MIMLRSIPRQLRCSVRNFPGRYFQRMYRGMSAFDESHHRRNSHHNYEGYQSTNNSSLRFSNSTVLTALILGTAIYQWRNSKVSHCSRMPEPLIYVDWSPPGKKSKKKVVSDADDQGDIKSVYKSELSGVELEDIPKVPSSPKPQTSSSSAQPISSKTTKSSASSAHKENVSSSSSKSQGSVQTTKGAKEEDDDEISTLSTIIDESAIGIPEEVPYLIIGSGTAGMAAARSIRGSDTSARVLIIGDEPHSPYMRPPLSKELWRRTRERQNAMLSGSGNMKRHSWMFFESDNFFIPVEKLNAAKFGGVALWKNKRVARLNVEERYVELESGERVRFQKCLLATGGKPRLLPALAKVCDADNRVAQRVQYFRTISDFTKLREMAMRGGRIVIIGGGFLGSELAVSLADLAAKMDSVKLEVVQVYRDSEGNMSHVLPPYLADYTRKYMENKGVKVITPDEVSGATWDSEQSRLQLTFQKNEPMSADFVVVSVGLDPNTQLAETSGLETDAKHGGFLVNAELEARGGVFAAGDASSYYDLLLGRRRVEHINHAEESGRIAGRNMAGEHIPYQHQSSFWSSLGRDISWDAIGLIDSNLETQGFFAMTEEGKPDYSNPGVVFYMRAGKLVGILLWNLPDDIYVDEKRYAPSRLNLVRKVLDDRRSYSYDELAQLAREFDVYETIADDYEDLKEYMQTKALERDEAATSNEEESGETKTVVKKDDKA